MQRDPRPSVALLQRAARRHRDLCYILTDRSNVDEYTVAITRTSSADAGSTPAPPVDIVNRGAAVWPVIIDNRPVEGLWANAVPAMADVRGGLDESGLRPNRVQWHIQRTSQYGTTMIDAAVGLLWTYGARHQGSGAYIPRLWIDVPFCEVGWGVRLKLTAHALRGRNVGSDDEPIAGVPVAVSGSITTPLGDESLDWRMAIRGDGSTTRWWSGGR